MPSDADYLAACDAVLEQIDRTRGTVAATIADIERLRVEIAEVIA